MRRRVLVVQPSLQPPGGGNGVAAWVLQALQDHHDVGVLTWQPVNVEEMNRFYGTAVRSINERLVPVPAVVRAICDLLPFSLTLLKRALLFRATRQASRSWDVLLTVHNEADFGRRGIQYVHYPAYRRPRPKDDVRWYHGPPPVLDAYYRLADRLAKVSLERVRQNLTLVNSDWTGRIFRDWHGVTPVTVYPPVHTAFRDVAWEDRVDGFLCIGRVSPEKEIDRVMDIVSRLRRRHPHLTLRIVGTLGRDRYATDIARRVRLEGDWVSIDEYLSREALLDLIPQYRYGIHGMYEEHFGMAPAEMVAAGCIVFVPDGGGQVEVVGGEPRLMYASVEDAVESITYVLEHPAEQSALRTRLASRVPLFSTERFVATIRGIVETFPRP